MPHLFQAVDRVMSLALCLQVTSQAFVVMGDLDCVTEMLQVMPLFSRQLIMCSVLAGSISGIL